MTGNELMQQVDDFYKRDYLKVKELILYGNYGDVADAEDRIKKTLISRAGYRMACHMFAEIDGSNKRYGLKVQFT